MGNVILLFLGVIISVMGVVNIKGNISTIHAYNRRNVKEEDIPKYGKAVGTGTLIMGISLVLGFIASLWSEELNADIVLIGVLVGLGFILYGPVSYTHLDVYKRQLPNIIIRTMLKKSKMIVVSICSNMKSRCEMKIIQIFQMRS